MPPTPIAPARPRTLFALALPALLLVAAALAAPVVPAQTSGGGGGGAAGDEPTSGGGGGGNSTPPTSPTTTPTFPPSLGGTFVLPSDADVNLTLSLANGDQGAVLCHTDADGDAAYDPGEALLLVLRSTACGMAAELDLRLSGPMAGLFVRASDPDFLQPLRDPSACTPPPDGGCAAVAGDVPLASYDANGNAVLDEQDTLYADLVAPAPGRVDAGDLRLTPFAGFRGLTVVAPGDPDVNLGLAPAPADADSFRDPRAVQYHDADGDGALSLPDRVYWHRGGTAGTVAPGDVRLSHHGGGSIPPVPPPPPPDLLAQLQQLLAQLAALQSQNHHLVQDVSQLNAQLNAMLAQNAQLQQENAALRAQLGGGQPPRAVLAPLPVLECAGGGSHAILDGSASFDPDGQALRFAWEAPGAFVENPDLPRTRAWFPLGTTLVSLTVWDTDAASTLQAVVTVRDRLAPFLAASVGPAGAPQRGIPGSGWFQGPAEVRLEASDACGLAVARYHVDRDALRTGDQVLLVGDGVHHVMAWAEDAAGHVSRNASLLTVAVDATPPRTVLRAEGLAGEAGWWRSDVRVRASGHDDLSGVAEVWVAVDSGPFLPGPFAVVQGDGRHVVRAFAVDAAGNRGPEARLGVDIDATPPSLDVALDGPRGSGGWWLGDVRASLAARDAGSGVGSTAHALDDGDRQPGPMALLAHEGPGRVTFWARDLAGNEARAEARVPIDRTDPTLRLLSPRPGHAYALGQEVPLGGTGLTVLVGSGNASLAGADAQAGLARAELLVDGVLLASASVAGHEARAVLPWDLSGQAAGAHVLEVRLTDAAGRTSRASLAVTTVPLTPEGLAATAACGALLDEAVCQELPAAPGSAGEACRLLLSAFVCGKLPAPGEACGAVLSQGVCGLLPGSTEAQGSQAAALPAPGGAPLQGARPEEPQAPRAG